MSNKILEQLYKCLKNEFYLGKYGKCKATECFLTEAVIKDKTSVIFCENQTTLVAYQLVLSQ